MKISERWLREWVNPPVDTAELAERLTLAGLELEHEPLVATLPSGVVVGRIETIAPHPQADRLRICSVVTQAAGEPHQIVCGAANARVGLVAPTALPGAVLPNGMRIAAAELRGVPSNGMLCSSAELGLSEQSPGLMELDADAPLGVDIVDYLKLKDQVLNLELTPNRGDCLSALGLARECAAIFELPLTEPEVPVLPQSSERVQAVKIIAPQDCTAYAGRVIEGIDPGASSPDWLVERLRRGGIRAIHPVVDISNYVMLELGQPMHAFDCAFLKGAISVRPASAGESLALLNGQTVELNHGELLIADEARPLALAGVMGGEGSGVTRPTTSIFLESARFSPEAVAGTGRRHKLHSDSLHRYERGVDPALQRRALERASELVLQICGGRAGPVLHEGQVEPEPVTVVLRHARLQRLLGVEVAADAVVQALQRLRIVAAPIADGSWTCAIPSARSDLRIEPDLIEEVARMIGYHNIRAEPYAAALAPAPMPERVREMEPVRDLLVARGFNEVVTYSFVDAKVQAAIDPGLPAIALDNPIAETLAVMRTSLLGGLLGVWRYNNQRQQKRASLFEFGVCFLDEAGEIREVPRLAGLMAGPVCDEQWSAPKRNADYFDLKAHLESVVAGDLQFEAAEHPALHPGQAAHVSLDGVAVGWIGAIHPRVLRELDLAESPIVFELDWEKVRQVALPAHRPVPEMPSSRRDLALVLADEVPAEAVLAAAKAAGAAHLVHARVFDVYRGKGLPDGCKSIALGLIFQDYSRTLTVEEVDDAVHGIADCLTRTLGASIRG